MCGGRQLLQPSAAPSRGSRVWRRSMELGKFFRLRENRVSVRCVSRPVDRGGAALLPRSPLRRRFARQLPRRGSFECIAASYANGLRPMGIPCCMGLRLGIGQRAKRGCGRLRGSPSSQRSTQSPRAAPEGVAFGRSISPRCAPAIPKNIYYLNPLTLQHIVPAKKRLQTRKKL